MKIGYEILKIGAVAGLLLVAHFAGFWQSIGAHPFWSFSATLIGLAIGFFAIILTWQKPNRGVLILLALLTLLAFQTSNMAKIEFVGSYAENRYAGSVWYYGFVFFVAGLFATLSGLLRLIFRSKV